MASKSFKVGTFVKLADGSTGTTLKNNERGYPMVQRVKLTSGGVVAALKSELTKASPLPSATRLAKASSAASLIANPQPRAFTPPPSPSSQSGFKIGDRAFGKDHEKGEVTGTIVGFDSFGDAIINSGGEKFRVETSRLSRPAPLNVQRAASLRQSKGGGAGDQPRVPAGNPDGGQFTKG